MKIQFMKTTNEFSWSQQESNKLFWWNFLYFPPSIFDRCLLLYNNCSYFIKLLLEKKYALPYRVVDAVVAHFMRFFNETRIMPVIWHQSLLAFVQRSVIHHLSWFFNGPSLDRTRKRKLGWWSCMCYWIRKECIIELNNKKEINGYGE